MVLEQINTDENKENISANELRDAVKTGGFLNNENNDYDENIKLVGDVLNNSEQLSEEDIALVESLKSTLNAEKEQIKNGNTVTEEDKKLLKVRIDLLGEDSEEVHKLEALINLYDNEVAEQGNEVNTQNEKIIQKFGELSVQDIKSLKDGLSIGGDLINDIDGFLDKGNMDLTNTKCIKAVNILNNLINEDQERHEKLKNIVQRNTMKMSKKVNDEIGGNGKGNADYYSNEQKMLIQLRANVCYGETLTIDGKRGEYLFSFEGKNDNQRLTTIYIYRLELITRQDVITYRHEHSEVGTTDNLLNIPELDEILSVLPREDQNEILENFLGNCFFKVRYDGLYFEDLIGSEYFKNLITLAVKVKTEGNISVEQGIRDRQNLIQSLDASGNESIIKNIQEEIDVLSTKNPATGEYTFKTMGEYYQYQVDELTKQINLQNKNNVDINQRQCAAEEARNLLEEFNALLDFDKHNETEEYKGMLLGIINKLATMYNDKNTPKYREWIEKGELIDMYVIKNLAVKFNKYLSPEEQNRWGQDFLNFMNKCSNEVSGDINRCSDTLDIVSQIESIEIDGKKYELEPTYGKPGEFLDDTAMSFFSSPAGAGLLPPNMHYPLDPNILDNPTSYKLQLGMTRFEGGPWVKDVFNQVQSGEMNVVITQQGYPGGWVEAGAPMDLSKLPRKCLMSAGGREVPAVYNQGFPGELCKYEEHDGDIWLRKFNSNGTLPSEPTKIITGQEIVQSNLAMSSAIESLDTKDFNDVMNEFKSEEKGSFMEIQESIEGFMNLYKRQNLSHDDVGALRRSIKTMFDKIASDDIDTNKLRKLRASLVKMQGNGNRIQNPYEESIQQRISQIDTLIKIKEDPTYRQNLLKLANLESNDDWYEQVDWVEIVSVLGIIATLIAGILLALPSGGTSMLGASTITAGLTTFLTSAAAGAIIQTTTYLIQQEIITARNFRYASRKPVEDGDGNIIGYLPGYIEENEMTTFYQYRSGKISTGEYLWNVTKELGPVVAKGFIDGLASNMLGSCLSQLGPEFKLLHKCYGKGKSCYKLFTSLLTIGITTDVIFQRWSAPNLKEVDIIKDIDKYFDILIPKNLRSGDHEQELQIIFADITCKSIDLDGNLSMEYNPDSKSFETLLKHYTDTGGIVHEGDNGIIIVEFNDKSITLYPSKAPAQYRSLSPYEKETLERVGGIIVDHYTGSITYKNPEGLENLRLLGAYMENSGEGEVFIADNGLAKIMFKNVNGSDTIITAQPEIA